MFASWQWGSNPGRVWMPLVLQGGGVFWRLFTSGHFNRSCVRPEIVALRHGAGMQFEEQVHIGSESFAARGPMTGSPHPEHASPLPAYVVSRSPCRGLAAPRRSPRAFGRRPPLTPSCNSAPLSSSPRCCAPSCWPGQRRPPSWACGRPRGRASYPASRPFGRSIGSGPSLRG
jgi:hypothetical protein